MPAPKNDMTVDEVRQLFDYDEKNGCLVWKNLPKRQQSGGNNRIGKKAGSIQAGGYLYVQIEKRRYLVHRLIFLHRTGKWPKNNIDHIKDRLNNIEIRPATSAQNSANRGKQANNTSGHKGVSLHAQSGKWRAQIVCEGKYFSLGLHATKDAAFAAYKAAALKLNGEFARF